MPCAGLPSIEPQVFLDFVHEPGAQLFRAAVHRKGRCGFSSRRTIRWPPLPAVKVHPCLASHPLELTARHERQDTTLVLRWQQICCIADGVGGERDGILGRASRVHLPAGSKTVNCQSSCSLSALVPRPRRIDGRTPAAG